MSEKDASLTNPSKTIVRLVAALLQGLQYRLELFSLELKEEQQRLITLTILLTVAVFAIFMAFLTLNFALIAAFWETARVEITVGLGAFYLLLGIAIIAVLKARISRSPKLFSATITEIKKDFKIQEEKRDEN